ncbi:MAG TPA: efflux RND transporter periplasmic adaptor subunit [Candidatus Angelobacter sp.]
MLAVLLITAGLIAAKRGGTKIDPSKLGKVEKGDLAKSVVATGKIEAITKVEVKSKASGIVEKLLVDYGDTVKKGQVLAELDKQQIQAQVNQQKASLEAAEAAARAAHADLERAKYDAEGPDVPMLKRAYERAQQMAKEGVVSPSALDDAQKNYEMAVNKQQLGKANVIGATAKLSQAQAQVSQAKAQLAEKEEELRNSTIVSPIDGVVLSRDVEAGSAVSSILVLGSSATLVMTLGDTREVYVKGKVDESDIGKVYMGQPARIKVESYKDRTFLGKVTKISPMGVEKDNVTTFEVRVSVDNSKGELKSQMTANAEVIQEEHKGILIIPEAALSYDKDRKASVEVPDAGAKDGKRKVAVTVGISNGSKTELLGGLKEGQQVVLQ